MDTDKNTPCLGFAAGLERVGWELQEVDSVSKERIYRKKVTSLDGAGFHRVSH